MKTLYIVRHAKSSWDHPSLTDFQRPLNSRGEKDAPRMGKRLRKENTQPDLILSSPALRALTTAQIIADAIGYRASKIQKTPALYHASEETILEVLHTITDDVDTVMIFGHNPGLTDFANELLGEEIGNIPTTGVVAGKLEIDSWKEASWGCGKMKFFDYPKKEH